MESHVHSSLKRVSAAWLLEEGCCAVGIEVRCPGSRYRVDAAGYLDQIPWPTARTGAGDATLWSTVAATTRAACNRRCEPRTIIVECKQSRNDFIRDDKRADELITLRDEARRWKAHLEETCIKVREPELRESGTALFAEMESWNFARSRAPSYRKLLRRIRTIEDQLYGHTKFSLMSRYRVADQLYLMAPRGLLRPRELPLQWGLIEVDHAALRVRDRNVASPAHIRVPAPLMRSSARFRALLLRNIAVAATRAAISGLAEASSPAVQNPATHPPVAGTPLVTA